MFFYFGYGSNMSIVSLRAKGVTPTASVPGVLRGWQLRFNVAHFFRHEGGMGNIEPCADRAVRGEVHGIVHECADADLELLDVAEAYPHGYDRIVVHVETPDGPLEAVAYVGTVAFVDDSCLPSERYLNLLVSGATDAGLDPSYIDRIRHHAILPPWNYPPFEHPPGDYPSYVSATLAERTSLTAVGGAVFDMSRARPQHDYVRQWFGGKDMTLFHVHRHDSSDGTETLDDVANGRLNVGQAAYVNAYLHECAREYDYVGRYDFGEGLAAGTGPRWRSPTLRR